MYPVSEAFLAELRKHTRVEHVRGSIGSALFTDSNVLSMNISNRCSDTSDITFGSAYIGQLQATFVNVAISRGSWGGKVITLFWGLDIYDEDTETTTTEWLPIGLYEIASAEWTDVGVNIVANDYMEKFEKDFTGVQTQSGGIYDFASYACSRCGLTFGMTRDEVETTLPNGDQILGLYEENNIKTWRDLMSWLAQAAGGFVTADRDGSIVIRSFANSAVVDEWGAVERIVGTTFSDYETLYDGISVVNIEDQTLEYYSGAGSTGDGTAINLGQNPFLQYGLKVTRDAQRQRIANVAHSIAWTPFSTRTLSCLAYDLGDLVECTEGVAGSEELTCCVQSYDWTFKNTTAYVGYGADPRLSSGYSKTDKNLQGLLSKVESGEITYYQFRNIEEIELENNVETTIASIKFAAKKNTDVDIWLEVKLNTENISEQIQVPVYDEQEDPETHETEEIQVGYWYQEHELPITALIKYYFDDHLIGYQPVETWNEDGYHTIHYGYFLPNVDNITNHTFVAKMILGSGTGMIAIDDANMIVRGQALVGSVIWDGTLDVADETGLYEFRELTSVGFTESAPVIQKTWTADDPEYDGEHLRYVEVFTDDFEIENIGADEAVGLVEDGLSINMWGVMFAFITEDGSDALITEGDEHIIVTEYDEL